MRWFIDWALNRVISTIPTGMTEEEQYAILARMNEIEGIDKLFRALISADIAKYFDIPETDNERQARTKGSAIRLRWLRREMQAAAEKLKLLRKSNVT